MNIEILIMIVLLSILGGIPLSRVLYYNLKKVFEEDDHNIDQDLHYDIFHQNIDYDEYQNALDRLEIIEIEFGNFQNSTKKRIDYLLQLMDKNLSETETRFTNIEKDISYNMEKIDARNITFSKRINDLDEEYKVELMKIRENQKLIMSI
jgi:hypothetical protein